MPQLISKWAHNRDGTIVAMIAESHGTGGVGGGPPVPLPYVYSIADNAVTHSGVRTNFGNQRAMRAPGIRRPVRSPRPRWTTWLISWEWTRSSSGSRT